MKSSETMQTLADAFLELAGTMPLKKVSVTEIVRSCGMNRKTFYYHFVDKDHLVIWVFRQQLALALKREYDEDELVYQTEADDIQDAAAYASLPYYVHHEVGFHFLDHTKFFTCIAEGFDANRSLYVQFMRTDGRATLQRHLFDLYAPAMRRDALFILGNRYLKPRVVSYIADYHSTAFIHTLLRCVEDPSIESVAKAFEHHGNLTHDAMRNEIEQRRIKREL